MQPSPADITGSTPLRSRAFSFLIWQVASDVEAATQYGAAATAWVTLEVDPNGGDVRGVDPNGADPNGVGSRA